MVDYSKWDNIEISDDEADTHPNINSTAQFCCQHQTQIEGMAELEREKEELKKKKQSHQAHLITVKERLQQKSGNEEDLKKELEKIEKEGKDLDRQENELILKEQRTPWNVDTISKPGLKKTLLNKQETYKSNEDITDKELDERVKKFIMKSGKSCKKYGMLQKHEESRRFLQENPQLVCEETINYLNLWCIQLQLADKKEQMMRVAHECICLQHIIELAGHLKFEPQACINKFFMQINKYVSEYKEIFEAELELFKERIRKRAQEKANKLVGDSEKEQREAYTGAGNLDPMDVFQSSPEEMQKCFEERDVEMLEKSLYTMPVEEAKFHMKRCVDSGLSVPNAAENDSIADVRDDETNEVANRDSNDPKDENDEAVGKTIN